MKQHVEAWRRIMIGEVQWENVRYRDAAGEIRIPVRWKLRRPSEWIEAIGDPEVRREFESLEGIDTKFFERHAGLVSALLDVRFDGEVGRLGLDRFLDARCETDHWLLAVDLDGRLLPFEKMRLRSGELRERPLPAERLLIVENDTCQHLLPRAPGVIAVLGAGLDSSWTTAPWLATQQVAYWGDIDTWGLQCLSAARASIGHLESLLMTEAVFEAHRQHAVPERVNAGESFPSHLVDSEAQLYRRLLREPLGRLEQEFLPTLLVHQQIEQWCKK